MNTFAEYVAIDAVNWSSLKHLWSGSPLHYRHHRQAADKDTAGRAQGRLLHALVLDSFDEEFVVYADGDRRGNAWKEFAAANAGRTIVKPNEIAAVEAQAAAVRSHRAARLLIGSAQTEQTVTWTDPDTGLPCKGRIDALDLDAGYHVDLKGCGSLSVLDRQCHRLGYVHQLVWYARGIRAAHGVTSRPYMVGVETSAPHDVGVWMLDRDLIARVEQDITQTMRQLADCVAMDHWPGAMPDVEEMFVPSWMISDELEIPMTGLEDGDEQF